MDRFLNAKGRRLSGRRPPLGYFGEVLVQHEFKIIEPCSSGRSGAAGDNDLNPLVRLRRREAQWLSRPVVSTGVEDEGCGFGSVIGISNFDRNRRAERAQTIRSGGEV